MLSLGSAGVCSCKAFVTASPERKPPTWSGAQQSSLALVRGGDLAQVLKCLAFAPWSYLVPLIPQAF